jgi:tetratricopeptide (TPR) repeat protein
MSYGSRILYENYAGDREMTDLRNRHFQVQLLAEKGDISGSVEIADSMKICLEEFGLETAVPAYWYATGMIEYQGGDLEASIAALERAVEIDWMNSSWTHYVLGEVYLAAEMPEEAAAVLERAVEMCGTYSFKNPILAARAHYLLGRAYEMVGESSKAIVQYEEFLEIWKDADSYLGEVPDARLRLNRLKTV